ncbi:1-propanol dehydrogenase PduQ [Vibrio mangrovi]|uniref:1-propanol dehydrogenase PduQ n=1 Tax=Vibrio mangrovi TaxID=474394 RepID=A0A1Y6IY90_9VIBR|nr:1-propanol dehydrogenase PduQ [Vibrio mangrovi]MDW6005173.1 1-propanol dehydrogenase PduQ [Vibrio mangrovi]SMS02617.1 Aldehyde-alcohol dehydrogenase [Vibrio mangrovi]
MKQFSISTMIYSGEGSLHRLARIKNRKVWIVCDEFLATGEAIERIRVLLQHNEVRLYTDIQPDPSIATIVSGMEALIAFTPDIVIGFGGGSAIDAAKAMVFFAAHFNVELERCIAIPTTSGTGSEVTSATVITDPVAGIKYPLFDRSIYPDEAILDPTLTVTVPPHITANTGMDVLTHAIEAYVSTKANDFTDALADKAIHAVFEYLPTAFKNGACVQTREKMHNASCMAGIAFSQSGLGINHAIAHQLGGKFHIAHGLANALLLPHVIRFNARHDIRARKRYARIAKSCRFCHPDATPEAGVNQLIHRIKLLQRELKLATSLRMLKIMRQDILKQLEAMAHSALQDSTMATTPYQASDKQVRQIIEALL